MVCYGTDMSKLGEDDGRSPTHVPVYIPVMFSSYLSIDTLLSNSMAESLS